MIINIAIFCNEFHEENTNRGKINKYFKSKNKRDLERRDEQEREKRDELIKKKSYGYATICPD